MVHGGAFSWEGKSMSTSAKSPPKGTYVSTKVHSEMKYKSCGPLGMKTHLVRKEYLIFKKKKKCHRFQKIQGNSPRPILHIQQSTSKHDVPEKQKTMKWRKNSPAERWIHTALHTPVGEGKVKKPQRNHEEFGYRFRGPHVVTIQS